MTAWDPIGTRQLLKGSPWPKLPTGEREGGPLRQNTYQESYTFLFRQVKINKRKWRWSVHHSFKLPRSIALRGAAVPGLKDFS